MSSVECVASAARCLSHASTLLNVGQIVQSKWKTLKHSDGAELAWKEMTLPHPVTLSRQKKKGFVDGEEAKDRGEHTQGFTRAVNVGVTTLRDTCIKTEIPLRLSTDSK